MQEIVLDEEIRSLIPPPSDAERKQLEENLLEDGCRDHLITWANHGVLLDGYTRHEICTEHKLKYSVKALRFENREEAINWVIANQLGRRNLTKEQAAYLRGRRYNLEKQSHGGQVRGSIGQNVLSLSTAEKLADEYGVTDKTIKRDGEYAEALDAVPDEVKDAVLKGEIKSTKAAVETLAELPKPQQRAAARLIARGKVESVKDAVDEVAAEPEKPKYPPHLQPAFDQQPVFRAAVQAIGKVESSLEALLNGPAGAFLSERWLTLQADLKNASRAIKFCMPHAVCPFCRGKGCHSKGGNKSACRGGGWVVKGTQGKGDE